MRECAKLWSAKALISLYARYADHLQIDLQANGGGQNFLASEIFKQVRLARKVDLIYHEAN